jgi:hypothetical protein
MIFRSFTHFLGILSIHFQNFGKGKSFQLVGRLLAQGHDALAWPSGGFSWTGQCQPTWCGARGAVTVPARRNAVHPPTAHRWPARGVLSSSSMIEGWPICRAKLQEEGHSREAGRWGAVGNYRRRWHSWRNLTRKSTRCRSWCGTSSTGLHHGSASKEREWR